MEELTKRRYGHMRDLDLSNSFQINKSTPFKDFEKSHLVMDEILALAIEQDITEQFTFKEIMELISDVPDLWLRKLYVETFRDFYS